MNKSKKKSLSGRLLLLFYAATIVSLVGLKTGESSLWHHVHALIGTLLVFGVLFRVLIRRRRFIAVFSNTRTCRALPVSNLITAIALIAAWGTGIAIVLGAWGHTCHDVFGCTGLVGAIVHLAGQRRRRIPTKKEFCCGHDKRAEV